MSSAAPFYQAGTTLLPPPFHSSAHTWFHPSALEGNTLVTVSGRLLVQQSTLEAPITDCILSGLSKTLLSESPYTLVGQLVECSREKQKFPLHSPAHVKHWSLGSEQCPSIPTTDRYCAAKKKDQRGGTNFGSSYAPGSTGLHKMPGPVQKPLHRPGGL